MSADVDFAAHGLLDGLEGEARAERLALLVHLSERGLTLQELRTAHENGILLFAGADRIVGGGNEHTMREIATQTGLDPAFLRELLRASGQAVPGVDERTAGSGELALARLVAHYRALGVAEDDLLEVSRVLARGFAPVAQTMRRIVLKLALSPGASEQQLAANFSDVAATLAPLLDPLLGEVLRLHLRDMARTEAVTAAELNAGSLPGAREVGVCFADLVGFTRAGEVLDPDEVGAIALTLERVAAEIVAPPVQIVKTLGDGVMLVSPELGPLVGTAISLVESAAGEDGLPELRAGVAHGTALSRAADWYGRPVNLASRLSDIARPGSVLAHDAVRERLRAPARERSAFAWSFAGPRKLKGIDDPVRLYRVRRARAEHAGD
ncbi:MAG: adenylate/guanylate cyclase domain-containing protein [Acidobacteriota bacterium]|nr:adenylate/guanylate cyclase domain-containing protein [Acidobacteriota bacterium]